MVTDDVTLLRLIMAFLLGGLIGLEREFHGRAAGLRTHILVTVGATLIMLTSLHVADMYRGVTQVNPARIAAQVVSGIGFLGAGTIIRFRASVRGLTTAASLWAAAGIGLAVGSGLYTPALLTATLVLIALFFLTKVERGMVRKEWFKTIAIETRGETKQLQEVRAVLSDYNVEIKDLDVKKSETTGNTILEMTLRHMGRLEEDHVISDITHIDGVIKAAWRP